nr:overexpressed in colon carcinoma 1 protein isoform X1 [Anser cygnoides]
MGGESRRSRRRRRRRRGGGGGGVPAALSPPRLRPPPAASRRRSAPHRSAPHRSGRRPWAAATPRPAARAGEVPQGLLKMYGDRISERSCMLMCSISFGVTEQKNLYQMMTKGGTTVVCMLVCHQMRLPWFPVRRKLHRKKEINTARSKQLEQSSAKTICQCFSESCLSAEDFCIYIAFQRAKQIRAPKNLNCCKFQLRVKLKVQH